MIPEIIELERLLLAGVVDCGKDAGSIDIHRLWNRYHQSEIDIENQIEGCWYELHVGDTQGHGSYSVFVGIQIKEIGALPVEVSLKIIPAGRYAHFAHVMKDGRFGDAFARVSTWVSESQTEVKDFGLQRYDRDFDPNNKNSVLHIFIPLV